MMTSRSRLLAACVSVCCCHLLGASGQDASSIDRMDGPEVSILLMAHQRVASVDRILSQLLAQQQLLKIPLSVVLAQSAESDTSPNVVEMRQLWQRYRGRFHSGRYVLTQHLGGDRSFSVNATRYGSKRNALANLLHGLDELFLTQFDGVTGSEGGAASSPSPLPLYTIVPSYTMVLEDDAVVSPDLLNFFTFAKDTATRRRIHRIEFATALSEVRPSLLVGMRDVEALARLNTRRWFAPSSSSNGSDDEAAASSAVVVDALVGTPRTVFTTRAWSLSRRAYRRRLRPLLSAMLKFEAPVVEALPAAVPAAAAAAGNGIGSTPLPPLQLARASTHTAWRASVPELAACLWCNDYCYDHAIEWVVQGIRFLAPRIPRVSQGGEGGMSSDAPATNPIYEGPPVEAGAFQLEFLRSMVLRLFPGLGTSAIAPLWHIDGEGNAAGGGRDSGDPQRRASAADLLGIVVNEPVCQLGFAAVLLLSLLLNTLCDVGPGGCRPCSLGRVKRLLKRRRTSSLAMRKEH